MLSKPVCRDVGVTAHSNPRSERAFIRYSVPVVTGVRRCRSAGSPVISVSAAGVVRR